jgi:antitoxin component YwqK of YwqJK toxin-antitoxin module
VHRLDIGEWKNSALNGKGKNYDIENDYLKYEGDYKNDTADGDGTFYRNGNIY